MTPNPYRPEPDPFHESDRDRARREADEAVAELTAMLDRKRRSRAALDRAQRVSFYVIVSALLALAVGVVASNCDREHECEVRGGTYLGREGVCIRKGALEP